MQTDPVFRWVQLGVLAMGLPFAAIGACEASNTRAELRRDARTQGLVVDNRLVTDQRDGIEEHAYVPVVEFRDANGRAVRFTDPNGSLPPDYASGDRVDVAFDPSDPTRARITSWKRLWLVPTILVVVGLLPSAVCAIVLRRVAGRSPG